jgi:transposase InsO family protein
VDATESGRDAEGNKLYIHEVQDMCSRYRLDALVSLRSQGNEIAAHLERRFLHNGAPLFIKRDNGSPFNCIEVNEVLCRYGVLPLNSPAHYPRYNGAIERGIGLMKRELSRSTVVPAHWDVDVEQKHVRAVHLELNVRKKRTLQGASSSEAYHGWHRHRFSKQARAAILEWLNEQVRGNIAMTGRADQRSVARAWRKAAETWLRCHGLIAVSKPKMCHPIINQNNDH